MASLFVTKDSQTKGYVHVKNEDFEKQHMEYSWRGRWRHRSAAMHRAPVNSERSDEMSLQQHLSSVERVECGFSRSGPAKPAHLARLLLMAGDIEANPGPCPCTICGKHVSERGYSIRCTWCQGWVHQACSGMTKDGIRQIAKQARYSYTCGSCESELQKMDTPTAPPNRARGSRSKDRTKQKKKA